MVTAKTSRKTEQRRRGNVMGLSFMGGKVRATNHILACRE